MRPSLLLILVAATACLTACATTGAVPRPFPTPSPAPAASSAPVPTVPSALRDGSGDGYAISGMALSLQGAPYRNGGSEPSGFDCSGFVWYVFDQHGIPLPRTVTDQFQIGSHVDKGDVRAGDLVFFDTGGAGLSGMHATHVGISIGGDEFVHAPSTKGQVRVERLGSGYWSARFLEARRVL
ncbi:MAG: NlpC/P60 family protein [Acidobacteriota bacterium]|nr:NlpC/P60 family protein [Acidobacteriota bacterium]